MSRLLHILTLSAAACIVAPASAQPVDQRRTAKADDLGQQARAAGAIGDFERAADLFQQQLDLAPEDRWAWYNLARTLSALGKTDEAYTALEAATEHGFDDYHRLTADAMLAPVRESRQGRTLLADWSALLDRQRDRNIEESADIIAGPAERLRLDSQRIVLLTSRDQATIDAVIRELDVVTRWARSTFFPEVSDAVASSTDPWVVVVLPEKADFERWSRSFAKAHGAPPTAVATASIGGGFDRESRRLVSRDIGASLRHEFAHVLHWRATDRVVQTHPYWLQEGLCSLIEDYDIAPETGDVIPAPSWRSNTAKKLLSAGQLARIEDLVRTSRETIIGTRPLAWYAQARTLMLYVEREGKLRSWYSAYRDAMKGVEDPAQQARAADTAFEAAFAKDLTQINIEYRRWLRDLPVVPEDVPAGAASLGVEVGNSGGEGPIVLSVGRTGTRLRVGDVIRSIDARGTADIPELVRVLASYRPGDRVIVAVRRGDLELELNVELLAREDNAK